METHSRDQSLIDGWLAQDLDEWTRRVLRRSFDPVTGAPYWLKRVDQLDFDPLQVETFADLSAFGPFPLDDLRTVDPATLVPQTDRRMCGRVWETGGTSGKPCRIFLTDSAIGERGTWKRYALAKDGFQEGRNWLHAVPSGPHIVGNSSAEIVDQYPYAGQVHSIDMDPRWVKKMVRSGNLPVANEYTDHLIEQIVDILSTQEIHYLLSTPALFQQLLTKHPDQVAALAGAALVGTRVTDEMYRDFVAGLAGGICAPWYGNTLFGISPTIPVSSIDSDGVPPYAAPYPHVQLTVVNQDDWTETVEYGQSGQVKLSIMQDDLFLPNILDRDQATRVDTGEAWPSDGVTKVGPLWTTRAMNEEIY